MASSREAICNKALGYAGVNKQITDITSTSSPSAQACNLIYEEYLRDLLEEFHWPWATRRANLTPYGTGAVIWDAVTNFAVGAVVQYGPNAYRALLANQNATPDQSPANWFQLTRDGWKYTCPLPDDFVAGIEIWGKLAVSPNSRPQAYPFIMRSDTIRAPLSVQRRPFDLEDANDGSGLQVLLTDLYSPVLKYTAFIDNPPSYTSKFVDAFAWKMAIALNSSLRSDESKAELCAKMAAQTLNAAISAANRNKQEDPEPMSEFEAARKGII